MSPIDFFLALPGEVQIVFAIPAFMILLGIAVEIARAIRRQP